MWKKLIQQLHSYFADFKQVKKSWLFCKQHSLLGHLWLPTPHCAVPVWHTRHYAMPLVTSYFPSTLLPWVLLIWESVFYSLTFFTLHSFLLVLRPRWGRQFNLNVSRASCWSLKHSSSPTICLSHSNPQKFYTGRFYLRVRAGQSRNINLYRDLALQNVSLEMFASHGIWTLFTNRQTC